MNLSKKDLNIFEGVTNLKTPMPKKIIIKKIILIKIISQKLII